MKHQKHRFPRGRRRLTALPGRAGLFALLVLGRVPYAQEEMQQQLQNQAQGAYLDEIAPSPRAAVPQTQSEAANPGEFQVFAPAVPTTGAFDQPFQWGKVIFRPHILYRFLYGNGIQSAPGEQQKTIIQEFSPGMLVDLGRDWVLDYTPTLRYYSSKEFQNGVDQTAVLRGGTTYDDWVLGLSQSYGRSTAPTIETGTQVSQESFGTALTAGRDLNNTVSIDLSVNQNFAFAQGLQNTREWTTAEWMNFKLWTRLNFGLGATLGYDNLQPGPNETFEQANGRLNWRVDDRISVSANVGVEDRQFQIAGRGSLISPLYGVSVQYQPFNETTVALTVSHSVSQSFLVTEITQNTSYGVTVGQRLLGKLHLDLSGDYNVEDFISSTAAIQSRTDNFYSFNARLSWPFLKRGSIGLEYEYSHDQSSLPGFTYGSKQLGFDISYTY